MPLSVKPGPRGTFTAIFTGETQESEVFYEDQMSDQCQICHLHPVKSELCDCESAQILQSTYVYIIAFTGSDEWNFGSFWIFISGQNFKEKLDVFTKINF